MTAYYQEAIPAGSLLPKPYLGLAGRGLRVFRTWKPNRGAYQDDGPSSQNGPYDSDGFHISLGKPEYWD